MIVSRKPYFGYWLFALPAPGFVLGGYVSRWVGLATWFNPLMPWGGRAAGDGYRGVNGFDR